MHTHESGRQTVFLRDIAEYLYERNPDHLKSDLREVVDIVFETIASALKEGRRVEFRGFGNFSVRVQKGRLFKNPKTRETVQCLPSRRVVFRPGKGLVGADGHPDAGEMTPEKAAEARDPG